ncbi:MAG: ABC transporter permease [Chloroflexi bacterium]|nr:ABC transporter permease [Chloroflexota bacterium]
MTATSEAPAAFRNAAARPGPLGLLIEAIGDITSRRRLVRYLVQAEVKKRGADTLLGNVWWILDPLLLMGVYVVLVTIITSRALPDYPLFIFAAILPWKWFTAAVTDATGSIVNQHRLIKQIAFPKIVLPVAATTAGIVGFGFGLIPLAGIMAFYGDRLSPLVLLIPIIAAVQYVFTVAVAILVAAGNVFFRDLGNVVRHLLRLWWYLSPGLYALSHLDEISLFENPVLRFIAHANPFAVLFEAYRSVIYGTPDGPPIPPDWTSLLILLVASTAFLALASVAFKRLEPTFAKVL